MPPPHIWAHYVLDPVPVALEGDEKPSNKDNAITPSKRMCVYTQEELFPVLTILLDEPLLSTHRVVTYGMDTGLRKRRIGKYP